MRRRRHRRRYRFICQHKLLWHDILLNLDHELNRLPPAEDPQIQGKGKWLELRDLHVPQGKTVSGWDYGEFFFPYLQFIDENTDIATQVPGPKMINTMLRGSWYGAWQDIPEYGWWHEPWFRATDPITPFLSWSRVELFQDTEHDDRRRHLSHQMWCDAFGLLKGRERKNSMVQVHPGLYVQQIQYMCVLWYHFHFWSYLRIMLGRGPDPFTIYPGYEETGSYTIMRGIRRVTNMLKGGLNIIWTDTPTKVQSWLRLLSAPVPTAFYKVDSRVPHKVLSP